MKFDRSAWLEIKEVCRQHGASVHIEQKRKHLKIVLTKGDRSRFVTSSQTPSDFRVRIKRLLDVRRTLAELDAGPAG